MNRAAPRICDPVGPRALASIALAALLAVAGCGDGNGDGEDPGPPAEPVTELEVTVWPQGRPGPSTDAAASCPASEAGTPDCRAAEAVDPADLAPTPPGVACTQIFGGPQEARIEGTLRGEPIEAELSRRNGCEIARYEAAEPLLELARR